MVSFHPPTGSRRLVDHRAEIAQLVEHATENRGVASSILALGTTSRVDGSSSGSGSAGRAHLAKVRSRVRTPSSAPIPPSLGPAAPSSSGRTADFGSVNRGSNPRGAASFRSRPAGEPHSGDVVKWLNTEVCKTSIHRFESGRRLQEPSTKPAFGPVSLVWVPAYGMSPLRRVVRRSGRTAAGAGPRSTRAFRPRLRALALRAALLPRTSRPRRGHASVPTSRTRLHRRSRCWPDG